MSKQGARAIIIDKEDNVATAATDLEKGDTISVSIGGYAVSTVLVQDISYGHKFALKNIERGEAIVKYGEVVGQATNSIGKGEHVHIHNVEGLKGRGDRQ